MKPLILFVFVLFSLRGFSQTEPGDAWIEKMLGKADSCYAIHSLAYAREYYNMAFGPMTKNQALHQKRVAKQNNFYYCVYVITADTALAHKEYEKAARLYNLALDLFKEDAYALAQRDKCSKNLPVKPICPADPNQEKVRVLFQRGDSLFNAGAYEKAKAEYAKILQINAGLNTAKDNIKRCDFKLWEASLPYKKMYDDQKHLTYEGTVNGAAYYTGTEYRYLKSKEEGPKLVRWEKGKVVTE